MRWPIYIINSVDRIKLSFYSPPSTQHHGFFNNLLSLLTYRFFNYLAKYPLTYLPAYLPSCNPEYLSIYQTTDLPIYQPTNFPANLLNDLFINLCNLLSPLTVYGKIIDARELIPYRHLAKSHNDLIRVYFVLISSKSWINMNVKFQDSRQL